MKTKVVYVCEFYVSIFVGLKLIEYVLMYSADSLLPYVTQNALKF